MAIITRQKSTTTITDMSGNTPDTPPVKHSTISKKPLKSKRKSFLATTIDELRKTEWPTVGYTLRWSAVILMFTALTSVSLGFFDNVFASGIKFVNCTSPQGQGIARSVSDCSDELLRNITLRNL